MDKTPRLLIAEDDVEMRNLLRRTLHREGYDVETVQNGMEAMELLRAERYDLLISDLRMPEKDGEQLLGEALRQDPTLKVIIITGYSELEEYLALMKKGAFDYITKPFKIPDLLDVIERAVGQVKR